MQSWRPENYLHGGIVIVPRRVAAQLDRAVGMARLAGYAHGDPEARAVLKALAIASADWQLRRVSGRTAGKDPEAAPASAPMTTTQAAGALGCTDRAVRLALEQERLPGVKDAAGRWRIERADVEAYKAAKAA